MNDSDRVAIAIIDNDLEAKHLRQDLIIEIFGNFN